MALNFQQNGSVFLRRILLVGLLVLSLALFSLYAREGEAGAFHRLQNGAIGMIMPLKFIGTAANAGASGLGKSINDASADTSSLSDLREQNKKLSAQLAEASEYKQEVDRLEKLLKMKQTSNVDGVGARIVGKNIAAWDQTITIDQGSSEGIEAGMTVMGNASVIGQVIKTHSHSAEVRLLTDPKSGVAALIQSNRGAGIVRGSLEGLLYLEDVDEENTPSPQDVIVTSGLGGSYASGLVIGTVVRVDQSKNDATGRIVVAPNDKTASLEEVVVVTGTSGDSAGSGGDGS